MNVFIRMNGTVLGVKQNYEYIDRMQTIVTSTEISEDIIRKLDIKTRKDNIYHGYGLKIINEIVKRIRKQNIDRLARNATKPDDLQKQAE